MTTVPNDLPENGASYYREYVEAGGAAHAARSYAIACAGRDAAYVRACNIRDNAEITGVMSQVLLATVKMVSDLSATAEKLRSLLPSEPEIDDDPDGHFK